MPRENPELPKCHGALPQQVEAHSQQGLCFVQRYKSEIRREDKDTIRSLCKVQNHYLITPEVFRELEASKSRGEKSMEVEPAQNLFSGLIKGKENPRDIAELIMMDE